MKAILRSPSGSWFHFSNPQQIIETRQIDNVLACLNRIESIVNREGSIAIGFVSYEAAPGFDSSLYVHSRCELPLVWFALFDSNDEWIDLPEPESTESVQLNWKPEISDGEYSRAIESIKNRLEEGATYQVNFTYRLRTPFSKDPYPFFYQLHLNQNPDYAAFIQTDRFSVCSASPELFFSLDGQILTSRPMKGTSPRGLTLQQDEAVSKALRNSRKAQAENVMIVDMIRNDMGRIATPGSVKVTELFNLEKYPTVWQLTSTVQSKTDVSIAEIFQALFPCASITGAPKSQTMIIIKDLEPSPRSVYTGAIGMIAPGRKARFNVSIRTVWIDHQTKTATFGTGGGIVWDSKTSHELKETLDKAAILHQSWSEFRLLETLLWTPEGGCFLLDRHLNRMRDSAEYFNFLWDEGKLRDEIQSASRGFSAEPQRVRLLLDKTGDLKIENIPIQPSDNPRPIRLQRCPYPVQSQNPFLYHKTTNRTVYEDARSAAKDCDDVILWNERGEITETSRSNLAVKIDHKMCTPPVACGLLKGTYRDYLLDLERITEKEILVSDIDDNTEIFVMNSVRKLQRAILIG